MDIFDEEATTFLEGMPQSKAMGYIARSIPLAPLCSLYQSFLKCLQGDDEQEIHQMANDGLADPLQAAVLAVTLYTSMPSVEELRECQRTDGDISQGDEDINCLAAQGAGAAGDEGT